MSNFKFKIMKKFILFAAITAAFATFTSCDNSEEFGSEANLSEEAHASTGEAISFMNWIRCDSVSYKSWERSPQSASTRGVSTDYTVYGYTTTSSTGNKKVILGKELASRMGIYNQIYIMETVTAKYELTINGLNAREVIFSPINSPKCGLYPDYTSSELDLRGYSISQKGDNVTLATKMVHVISDMSGRSYDQWYPCKPAQLEWCYNVYVKD